MLYIFDDCQINTRLYTLQRDNQTTRLRPKVFEVLLYLIEHRDRVVSKQELAEQMWPNQFIADSTLESTIRGVRQAVQDSGHMQRTIQTLPGHGYRFLPTITAVDEEDAVPPASGTSIQRQHEKARIDSLETVVESKPFNAQLTPRIPPATNRLSIEQAISESLSARASAPFFGRQAYLEWFSQHLQDAISGHPRVLLLQGEAGLGKTRLLKEMRVSAESLGIQVYSGRFFEHLTVPYLPFVEALRMELEQTPTLEDNTLDTEAELIRQLLPSTTAFTSVASDSTTAQAEQERIRLFLAVSRAFLTMAQRSPTLFVVDDLHWADPSSLDLFGHLIFTLADAGERESIPLILICTFRPEEGEERLPRLLARIQREAICHKRTLTGFDENESQSLLQSLGLQAPSRQLTGMISQVTQGNPMFIQEVLLHMVQQNMLEERGGYVTTTATPADIRLPSEVTSVISNRIQALSEDCTKILILAALYGDSISVEILEEASGLNEDMVFDLLEGV